MQIIPFSDATFWFITILFLIFCILLQLFKAHLWGRNALMISFNFFVVYHALEFRAAFLLSLLTLFTTAIYWTGQKLLTDNINISKKYLFIVSIICITSFLCYFKYALVQSTINRLFAPLFHLNYISTGHHIFFIGVSYFSFKFIHFLVECYKKNIRELDYLTFLNYILFFPSFFSGPINRFGPFVKSFSSEQAIGENLIYGSKRIINGMFKKIVLGDSLLPYTITALDIHNATGSEIIIGMYAYMFYIYFNFAGYTDMAIGCGKIAGISLPENFNYPFFRRNLQQFWANWHMSLTAWLTDYIYWPLARKCRHIQTLRKKPVTISNICIVITFLVCGLWHGDGLNFILWGLYHGIGLAILNGYNHFIKKYTSRNIKKFIHKSPIAYGISNLITFQYVAFGFLLFGCSINKLKQISSILF